MTMTATNAPTFSLDLDRMRTDAPILFFGGLFSTALIIVFALALPFEDRLLDGVNVWVKPLKFAYALAIYLLTLAYFARFASEKHNQSRATQWFHAVVVFCVIGEFLWIGGAAMFGTRSHFNFDNPIMEAIYLLMGAFAVTLTAASLVLGIAILRNKASGMSLAIGSSLIATFVTTLIVAGYMSNNSGHFVGGTSSDLLPFMGWARDIGDLRVSHFFATHVMHFAPAFALILFATGMKTRSVMIMPTLIFTAVTLLTFQQALDGQPFLPWLS